MSTPSGAGYRAWENSELLPEEQSPPTAAVALAFVAGLLILIEGALVAGAASAIPSSPAANLVGDLGGLGILFGILLFIFAALLWSKPDYHVILGVLVLVISFVSLFSGGGFFLGLLLGVIGGILAIIHNPD